MTGRATVKDLRVRNRAAVLRRVVLTGETTRATLANECGLSTATVTNVVADLIREGLVEEHGLLPSDGGRPIARLRPLASGAYVIGADVGEHGVTVEIFDLSLRRVDRVFRRLATRATSPARVAEALTEAVADMRAANPGPDAALVGIGLGLPGVVDTAEDGRPPIHAQSLGWQPTSLERVFGSMGGVPTFADNGAKTLATAEMWFGAARGRAHSIVVLVGRGLGIGVIAGGRLLRGTSSSAGEWGHTKVSLGGPSCQCGARGCIEAYVGGDAVIRRWREAGAEVTGPTPMPSPNSSCGRCGRCGRRAGARETIEILGLGLANLVNLFNPEQIVMGGWAGLRLVERRQVELRAAGDAIRAGRPG